MVGDFNTLKPKLSVRRVKASVSGRVRCHLKLTARWNPFHVSHFQSFGLLRSQAGMLADRDDVVQKQQHNVSAST